MPAYRKTFPQCVSHLFQINQADGSLLYTLPRPIRETIFYYYLPGSVSSNDEDRKLSCVSLKESLKTHHIIPRGGNESGLITVPREYI